MKADLINPILLAFQHVISSMAKINTKPEKLYLKKGETSLNDTAVTGYIGLAGEKVRGSLAITFDKEAISLIVQNVLGEKLSSDSAEVIDLTGELTNIIFGNAKHSLSKNGYHFDLAIPTVISGKNHIIRHNFNGPILVIPFSIGKGRLVIEVCFS